MNSKLSLKKLLMAGVFAGITAAIINTILFLIFHSAGVISDNIYLLPYAPMTVTRVIVSSAIPSIVGSLIFFFMDGLSRNSFKSFTIVAVIVVVVSLYSLFSVIPGITPLYFLVLCMMHIITSFMLLYFIRRAKLSQEVDHHYQTN